MRIKNCKNCGKEIEIFEPVMDSLKSDKPRCYRHRKYCSAACKQASYRQRALQRNIVTLEDLLQQGVMPHLEDWLREKIKKENELTKR